MRAELATIALAAVIAAVATYALAHPFDSAMHRWEAALAVALCGLALAWFVVRALRGSAAQRWLALAGTGALVIAVAFLGAELLVGPAQRVAGAPGQTYRPQGSARLAIVFPPLAPGDLTGHSAQAVTVWTGGRSEQLAVGQQLRSHSYVVRADSWPAAYVRAWSTAHLAQTVTQPSSVLFVSPVLQFPALDTDGMLTDTFAVPALHREVHVRYYSGLPSRGIDVPFVQIQIDEENGGALFDGVAVSGRPVRKAGLELVFDLGAYPVVSIAGAPDVFVYRMGMALIIAGVLGWLIAGLITARR
ncbi:MAG: hypothetical protein JOZ91_02185 [Candidatus Eremiobacteraeota bacterium]|nr:hypothetical protein [Candidatus Eremiobacteraeota bacterium]MBV8263943.1 hypothetical protein [Candidatus Eremiobacteraeota bacterium]MBV8340125.1 hypothetical protein [Candidatus Eremiobacteraeota bacterium]